MTNSAPDWQALQEEIEGHVFLPDSPDYELVRKPAIARFYDLRPQAVVVCRTPSDISETISVARRSGLPTATRSGGHCFAGRSSTPGIVIDVSPLSSVSVRDGVATVGAGARLGEVYNALATHDLTIPAGCGPTVGIAGLTLGGGLGILGRKHGLTSDHLLGAQVVLANGRVVDCDERNDDELFWALRGAGGGNFGVVTSLVFRTLPAPTATAFHLTWPDGHAVAVINAWQDWAPSAPDEIAASLLLTAGRDIDRPPLVNVFGAMLGTEADAAELLDEFVVRANAHPTSATFRYSSHRETKHYLAEHGPGDELLEDSAPGHTYNRSAFFGHSLPMKVIEALVEIFSADKAPGQSRELDFTPWGGAYKRVRHDATAFVHRDARFLLKHAVVVDSNASSAQREAAGRWLANSSASVHPFGTGGVYPNFPEPDLERWGHAYYGTNYDRLVRVKKRYDPDDFFCFRQSLRV